MNSSIGQVNLNLEATLNVFGKRAAIAAVLSILILAIVAWSGLLGFRSNESGMIVLQGNVDVRQVNLSFKFAGRIAKMMVDEGDKVEAGKIVASMEKPYFADEVRLARARWLPRRQL
jgi:HlyD family secretion protein